MTRKATDEERRRTCPGCGNEFLAAKPSTVQRCCSHACAFKGIGPIVRAAAELPEAIEKRAAKRRGRGEGKSYPKVNGRHAHRVVAERNEGRELGSHEVAHHRDENRQNFEPENIQVMTRAEHIRHHLGDRVRPVRTHCAEGHPLDAENTATNKQGRKRCVICTRAYDAKWKREKRAKT